MKKHYIFKNFLSRILLSAFCLLPFCVSAQNPYVITGSGTQFTATNNGSTIATNKPIQEVIDAIKLSALGSDCIIQFGNGTSTLNTGDANMTFDGGSIGKDWGLVSLTGKLTSASGYWGDGTIFMINGVSIKSTADITNTASGDPGGVVFYHTSNGTLTIAGGTILTTASSAINICNSFTGAINISGGMVQASASSSWAIRNYSIGTINISGGTVEAVGAAINSNSKGKITVSGNAVITSRNTNNPQGTIYLTDEEHPADVSLEITGGKIENTADKGVAIYNNASSKITISGGTVSATTGQAVYSGNGIINISGGTVSATTGQAVYTFDGKIYISGGTVLATTGKAAASQEGTIKISGGTVSVTTGYAVSDYDGSISISGGLVSATSGFAASSAIGVVKFEGGIAFAHGMDETNVIKNDYDLIDDAVIVAWDINAGTTTYAAGTSDDIFKLPGSAKAVWAKQGGVHGISVENYETSGFIPVEGVTVTGVGVGTLRATSLQVYPNPTTGQLTINNEQLTINNVELFDVYGKTISQLSTLNSQLSISINISDFPAGLYFLRIQTETGTVTQKIIKIHQF